MFKKILFSLGVFVFVLGSGAGVAKAARPDRPVYATVEQVQQMISDATASINAAITNLTTRVTTLESIQPSPQPTPPIEFTIQTETSIPFAGNPEIDFIKIIAVAKSNIYFEAPSEGTFGEYISNVAYWATVHTPDHDYDCAVKVYDRNGTSGNGDFARMYCKFPPHIYSLGTSMSADIYAEYGGKVTKETVTIDTTHFN